MLRGIMPEITQFAMDGISGKPLPVGFPYKVEIENACGTTFFPCLVGAIKLNESGLGDGLEIENYAGFDGGRGVMQVRGDDVPADWWKPQVNIQYAVDQCLRRWHAYWKERAQDEALIRAIGASYNAGYAKALVGYSENDIDGYTLNRYGERAYQKYAELTSGVIP